eukprot:5294946-Amphidinium_carterae.1
MFTPASKQSIPPLTTPAAQCSQPSALGRVRKGPQPLIWDSACIFIDNHYYFHRQGCMCVLQSGTKRAKRVFTSRAAVMLNMMTNTSFMFSALLKGLPYY